ncbi:glycosyltransferase family 4 protein [Thermodesulfobacteriota bacterium]
MKSQHDGRIRVCHVNTRFLRGGGTKNTLLTITNLLPAKYRITLVVGRDVNWEQLKIAPHIEVVQIPSMVRPIRPWKDLIALWKLYRLFRRKKFHIVHTHLAKSGILGRIAARMARVPIVIHSIHGSTFPPTIHPVLRRVYRIAEKTTGRFTHLFIPVAEGLKRAYLAAGVGTGKPYSVIHSGFDLKLFKKTPATLEKERLEVRQALGIPPDKVVLGYVANLEPRKGHVYALEMMKRLIVDNPNTLLLLAGEGKHRAFLESKATEWGLSGHVNFLGYRTDVHRILCVFDINIFTSLWEGLPQVLVQAAATGLPIVAFDVDSVGEIVHHGKNGFLVPVGEVEELTRHVEALITAPRIRTEMGAGGRRIVDDSWDVTAMVQQTDWIYSEMIRDKSQIPVYRAAKAEWELSSIP